VLGVLAFAAAAAAAAAVVLHVVLAAPVVAATSFSPGLIQIGVHAREVAFADVAGEVAASLTGCLTEAQAGSQYGANRKQFEKKIRIQAGKVNIVNIN
jgi:hypothetical protein